MRKERAIEVLDMYVEDLLESLEFYGVCRLSTFLNYPTYVDLVEIEFNENVQQHEVRVYKGEHMLLDIAPKTVVKLDGLIEQMLDLIDAIQGGTITNELVIDNWVEYYQDRTMATLLQMLVIYE